MIYQRALFLGRFQPLHNAHMREIHYGLAVADKLVIALGSCQNRDNIGDEFIKRNPFTSEERKNMIREAVGKSECRRIEIVETWDFPTDEEWHKHVIDVTWPVIQDRTLVVLGGNKNEEYVDELIKYLGAVKSSLSFIENLHATDIRNLYFHGAEIDSLVPYNVADYLGFIKHTNKTWFKAMKKLYLK